MRNPVLFVAVLMCSLLAVSPSAADEDSRAESPYFVVTGSAAGFLLQSTHVDADISGPIADVTVTQVYHNGGSHSVEAQYVFPGSTGAAVHGMTVTIGDRTLEAKLTEKASAREQFERARARGNTASLLEQDRPNVFRMNVTNVHPGATVEVKLRYSELLRPEGGLYRFVYPTVFGPRYTNGASERDMSGWTASPYLPKGDSGNAAFSLDMKLRAGMPIEAVRSTSHTVAIGYPGENTADIRLSHDPRHADRDFIVEYKLASEAIESGLLSYEGAEEKTFALLVEPPSTAKRASIVPREYAFVLDVSGSMNGFPIETARELVEQLLSTLRPIDTFNIILFAGSHEAFSDRFLPASGDNIDSALAFVRRSPAGGGTELYPALESVFDLQKDEGRSRSIVLVTDGLVSFERELFTLVSDNVGRGHVFPFGIGTSVNRHLIEGLAAVGRAEPVVVDAATEADEAARRFAESIASPVMTDITVSFEGSAVYDVEPPTLPDLFTARPIVMTGKWEGDAPGALRLRGRTSEGWFERRLPISNLSARGGQVLEQLWARERLKRLSDLATAGAVADNRDEVTNLALRYHLLSEHTSFIAVDSRSRGNGAPPIVVEQPLALPSGLEQSAVSSAPVQASSYGHYGGGLVTKYNDMRVSDPTNAVLTYLEGTFGALVMFAFGSFGLVCLIIASGTRRRAHVLTGCACLVIAACAFLLRGLFSMFFNDAGV